MAGGGEETRGEVCSQHVVNKAVCVGVAQKHQMKGNKGHVKPYISRLFSEIQLVCSKQSGGADGMSKSLRVHQHHNAASSHKTLLLRTTP